MIPHLALLYFSASSWPQCLLLISLFVSRVFALSVDPPSDGLSSCGQTQLRWEGSTGMTDVIVLDPRNNKPLKIFLQTPANTYSVTWPVIGVLAGRQVKIQVVDSNCQSVVSDPWDVTPAKNQDASSYACGQALADTGISIAQMPQLMVHCQLNYGESHTSKGQGSTSSSSSTGGSSSSSSSSSSPSSSSSSPSSSSSSSSTSSPSDPTPGQSNAAPSLSSLFGKRSSRRKMTSLTLPDGLLPKWLLVVSSLAFANVIGNYLNPKSAHRVYAAEKGISQATPLSSRLLAVWNFTAGCIRVYAAYNIHQKQVYELCIGTFLIVLAHFLSELFVYKTTTLKSFGFVSALVVATSSLTAMLLQYDFYVR